MEYNDIVELKHTIEQVTMIIQKINKESVPDDIRDVLYDSSEFINSSLYGSKHINVEQNSKDIVKNTLKLMNIWNISIDRRSGLKTDREFWEIYERFRYVDREEIINDAIRLFDSYPDDYKQLFISLPTRYTFLPGKIDINDQDYSLIPIYVDMLRENLEDFRWLYFKLNDYRSKSILIRIVQYWFKFNLNDLSDLHENIFGDYYDLDLIKPSENEIFVDCGAYIGDSILDYINVYGGKYKRIYGYEISPDTMVSLSNNLCGIENIILRQKGVGDKRGKMYIEFDNAGAKLSKNGNNEVMVTTLDEDIDEPVNLIKMDIEGAEIDALKGAKNHILQEKPRLLICTYHKPDDIFKIPRLINEIREDYSFYLRFNGRGIWPCDHVLFAI